MKSFNLKVIFFILFSFYSSGLTHAQYLNELKLHNSYSLQNDTGKTILTPKSPLLAGTLSFIIPGLSLGQIYNNVPSKVIRHLSISLGSFTLLILAGELKWYHLDIACGASNHDTWIPYSLAIIYLGNWVWSVVDAVITANNINKQIKLQKYRSGVLDKFKFGLTLDKNRHLNLKFAFEL